MSLQGPILTQSTLPEWLFYEEKADGLELTAQQTAYFEPQEFIQGHEKHWWQESKKVLKPKDIVLACLISQKDYFLRDIIVALQNLINFGFTIHTCLSEKNEIKVVPLTRDQEHRILFRLVTISEWQKEKFLVDQSQAIPAKSRDQILFITEANLHAFIKIFDNTYISKEALQRDEPLQLFLKKGLDSEPLKIVEDSRGQIHSCSLRAIIQTTFSHERLSTGEMIEVRTDVQSEQHFKEDWDKVVSAKRSLRILNLYKFKNLNYIFSSGSLDGKSFEILNELNLMECDITWDVLIYLLSNMPQLKTLHLYSCNIKGLLQVEDLTNNLKNLEALSITNYSEDAEKYILPSEFLEKVLIEGKNLYSINMNSISFKRISQSAPQYKEQIKLDKLTSCLIRSVSFDNDILFRMIEKSVNLKVLNLKDCLSPEEENINYKFLLNRLKNFEVNVTGKNFKIGEMLLSCNKVNIIDISSSNVSLEHLITYLNKKPTACTNLTLRHYNITYELFQSLRGLENLTQLKLINCEIENFTFDNHPDSNKIFKKMKIIDIVNLQCAPLTYRFILSCMPNLKHLNIKNRVSYLEAVNHDLFYYISLYHRQLRTVKLEGKVGLVASTFLQKKKCDLSQLKKIFIYSDDVSEGLIYAVLKKACNLSFVHLQKSRFVKVAQNPLFRDYLPILKKQKDWEIESDSESESESESEEDEKEREEEEEKRQQDHEILDAQTEKDPSISFFTPRVFYAKEEKKHPNPSLYRLEAFGKIGIKENILEEGEAPFILYRVPPLLVACIQPIWCSSPEEVRHQAWHSPSIHGELGTRLYATDEMELTSEWQNLPSMSAQEKITHFFIEELPSKNIQLQYDKLNHFYMIRLVNEIENINCKLHYVVDYPVDAPFPDRLFSYIKPFTQRQEGRLEFNTTQRTGRDYLNALIQQPVGSCSHRSFACKASLDQNCRSVYSQIIRNVCHDRIEIMTSDDIYTVDLGGYEAEQVIADNYRSKIKEKRKSKKKTKEKDLNPCFITWTQRKEQYIDPLSQIGEKVLVNVDSSKVEDYILKLQAKCNQNDRPFYYVDDPRDLICFGRWVNRKKDDKGELKEGVGGRCYDFLTSKKGKYPILIINYIHFEAADIVRFNTLLDDPRKIDGIDVPNDYTVVGIHDPLRENAYKGGDFNSRWSIITTATMQNDSSISDELFRKIRPHDGAPCYEVDLFSSAYWKSRLLGKWVLNGAQLSFQKGELEKALVENCTIHIKNGPWHLEDFRKFWLYLLNNQRSETSNEIIHLPNKFCFTFSQGYNWHDLNRCRVLDFEGSEQEPVYILNPSTFSHFIGLYEFNEDEKLIYPEKGWIGINQGKSIRVQLTRNIKKDQLAELLTTCKAHQVSLALSTSDIQLSNNVELVVTNDIDACVDRDLLQFDISECQPGDILSRLNASWEGLSFKFEMIVSDIWHALSEGRHVVLKGDFSTSLLDHLMPLLVQNGYLSPPLVRNSRFGKLTLITQSPHIFSSLTHTVIRVDGAMKLIKLQKEFTDNLISLLKMRASELINDLPLVKLRAILKALEIDPSCSLQSPWEGLIKLPKSKAVIFDLSDLSQETCDRLNAARLSQFEVMLEHHPFVNIVGQTAVGKTSFIQNLDPSRYKIYYGKKSLANWATDKSNIIKIWFDDEATLEESDLTMLEGLNNVTPIILLEGGKIVELTATHKVVTALNPVNHGGNRRVPALLERHGNTLIFEQLHPAQLYHEEIKPILENAFNKKDALAIGVILLTVYNNITQLSEDEVLISARELKMMALMVVADPIEPIYQNALEKAYLIGRSVMPEVKKAKFEVLFKELYPSFSYKKNESSSFAILDYYVTPSRFEHFELLSLLLKVRTFQREIATKPFECYGGLNMMVSEGEPGDGKSFSALNILKFFGFVEGDVNAQYDEKEKVFYFLPASMLFQTKHKILLKAFDEGAIVIMDEINSSSMMEKIINDLLCGKLDGKYPRYPGFKIIATQNPIYYAGRRAASIPMKRRALQCYFGAYTFEEMVGILIFKGVDVAAAIQLAEDFKKATDYAIEHHLTPLPNFRNLDNEVKKYLANVRNKGLEGEILQQLFDIIEEHEKYIANSSKVLSFYPDSKKSSRAELTDNDRDEKVKDKKINKLHL